MTLAIDDRELDERELDDREPRPLTVIDPGRRDVTSQQEYLWRVAEQEQRIEATWRSSRADAARS
jgi:hypothetical protein